MIRDPWLRALSILGCAIAGLYLVGVLWGIVQEFADIILLFFLAWLVAFVLEPFVATMVEGRLPRLAAIGLTYLTLLVVLVAGVILLVPALSLQIVDVARNLPTYVEQATAFLTASQTSANDWLSSRGSPVLVDIKSALNPQELSRRADALGPPILSKIPYLSRLYRNVGYSREAREIFLFVTPRLIVNAEEEAAPIPSP